VHDEHTVASQSPFAPALLHAELSAPQLGAASEPSVVVAPESDASVAPTVAGESVLVSIVMAESPPPVPGAPVSPESSPGVVVVESPESSPGFMTCPPSGLVIVASPPSSPWLVPASEEASLPASVGPPIFALDEPPHPETPKPRVKPLSAHTTSQPRRNSKALICDLPVSSLGST
jgi:hypothetical protein